MIEFKLFGFPVQIQTGFLFLAGIVLLFGLQGQWAPWLIAGTIGVYLLSILVHELGHALVSRMFGVSVEGIFIHGFGGHVLHGRTTLHHGLLISLAGPFAGLALAAFGLALYAIVQNPYAESLLEVMIGVNVLWSLFNLLPMFPLDGGHATLQGLQMVLAPRLAATITFGLGLVLGVLVAIAGLQYGWIFVALFAGSFAVQNFQLLNRLRGSAQEG